MDGPGIPVRPLLLPSDPPSTQLQLNGDKTMTLKAKAATIRRQLKTELGLTAKQVSVRCSRGSAVNVELKTTGVPMAKVEEIAKRQESIRYDGWGNILRGGNHFVFVRWDEDVLEDRADAFRAWIIANVTTYGGGMMVPGSEGVLGGLSVSRENGFQFHVWRWDSGSTGTHYAMGDEFSAAKVLAGLFAGLRLPAPAEGYRVATAKLNNGQTVFADATTGEAWKAGNRTAAETKAQALTSGGQPGRAYQAPASRCFFVVVEPISA